LHQGEHLDAGGELKSKKTGGNVPQADVLTLMLAEWEAFFCLAWKGISEVAVEAV